MDVPKHITESTSNILSELSNLDPIDIILNYYGDSHTKDQIKSELISQMDDPLFIAKQFARLAITQTRTLLHYGRGNVCQDILKHSGEGNLRADFLRDAMKYHNIYPSSPVQNIINKSYSRFITMKMDLDSQTINAVFAEFQNAKDPKACVVNSMMNLQVRTQLALHLQAGCCNEFSFVALHCFFALKKKLGHDFDNVIENMRIVCTKPPDDHMFLELDVKTHGHTPTKLICDPWAGYVGTLEEVPKDFFVIGKQGNLVYSSSINAFGPNLVNLCYSQQTHLPTEITCFEHYHKCENNPKGNYDNFIYSLPVNPTVNYLDEESYPAIVDWIKPFDYKNISQRNFEIVKSHFDEKNGEHLIRLSSGRTENTIAFYSQPDHPNIKLSPLSSPGDLNLNTHQSIDNKDVRKINPEEIKRDENTANRQSKPNQDPLSNHLGGKFTL